MASARVLEFRLNTHGRELDHLETLTAEPDARDRRATAPTGGRPPADATRARRDAGTRMARPRPTTAVDDGRTRSGIPGRTDGNADADGRNRPCRVHAGPGLPA